MRTNSRLASMGQIVTSAKNIEDEKVWLIKWRDLLENPVQDQSFVMGINHASTSIGMGIQEDSYLVTHEIKDLAMKTGLVILLNDAIDRRNKALDQLSRIKI